MGSGRGRSLSGIVDKDEYEYEESVEGASQSTNFIATADYYWQTVTVIRISDSRYGGREKEGRLASWKTINHTEVL